MRTSPVLAGASRSDEKQVLLISGNRPVFHTLGNDAHLAGAQRDCAIAQLDVQGSPEYEEEVVCIVVFVPDWIGPLGDPDNLRILV